ncbi:hypothetical protein [Thermococcus barophilus]|uniref:Uncharacterized protein n=1 Tax=Thermococcus barophilus TaxID=55802 RepID=A0A0S1XFG7_THEBA|nr:hypothetical protein [Thermococcus barophilus]ALM76472.1 hypothetical protein TBCH5v1_2583 [Thermococcus barophilus]
MAREYIFDDKRSIWHAFLGFISAFALVYSLLVLLIYTVYQIREKEKPVSTLGDIVEFLIGYIYGLAVVVWWMYAKVKGVL